MNKLLGFVVLAFLFCSHLELFSLSRPPDQSLPVNSRQAQKKKPPVERRLVFDGGYFLPTEPLSGVAAQSGWGTGFGGGVGILFDSLGNQFRLDISKYSWTDGSYTHWRVPFFVGFRLFPTDRIPFFLPFLEIGMDISSDKLSESLSETRFGFTPGIGFEFRYEDFIAGVNFRYHLIHDAYFSLGPYVGFRI